MPTVAATRTTFVPSRHGRATSIPRTSTMSANWMPGA